MQGFKTSKTERTSYASFFFGQNLLYIIVVQYLMLFYTDVLGISAAAAGTLFLITRVWDAVNDPIMGIIIDKINFKKGKFKPWIHISSLVLPLIAAGLFFNLDLSPTGTLIYAYVTYILFGMIYTISDVPVFALSTTMTDNIDERNTLLSRGRMTAALAAFFIVLFIPMTSKFGWTTTMAIYSALAFITMMPLKFFVKERVSVENRKPTTLKEIVINLLKNRYLLVINLSFLVAGVLNTGAAANYLAIYNLNSKNLIPLFMLLSIVPMLVTAVFIPKLIKLFGKRKLLIFSYGLGTISGVTLFFVGYDSIALTIFFRVGMSIGITIPALLKGIYVSDCIEYGAYAIGKRAEGISFSIRTLVSKLSAGLGAFFIGIYLEFSGFAANVTQTERSLDGIFALNSIYPAIGMALALLIVLLFYDLSESKVQMMVNEMSNRAETNKQ